jgi:manganese oxidase
MNARPISRCVLALLIAAGIAQAQRTITADVVALDQAFYNNRLGAFQAGGMIFALRSDVVTNDPSQSGLVAGKVMLRPDKRPRPIVLRMNVGDCLQVNFQNLLADVPSIGAAGALPYNPANSKTQPDTSDPNVSTTIQSATRLAGVHVMGMELKQNISDDASWIGGNPGSTAPNDPGSLAAPNQKRVYTFCAQAEGAFLLYSTAANIGYQDGFGGQLTQGLFGSVAVQPKSAEWYRSQVTRADLDQATYNAGQLPSNMHIAPKGNPQQTFTYKGKTYKLWTLTKTGPGAFSSEVTQTDLAGDPVDQNGLLKSRDFHPIINYQATYSNGTPILAMLDKSNHIVHSDLTAIITGPNAGRFAKSTDPVFLPNPTYPDRDEPYREFAIHYHDDPVAIQAFAEFQGLDTPACEASNTCGVTFALAAARDFFAINYGMAAIGPEVWANRINVGPMSQCATCKFEEFFLSSWAVADPAMVVDFPANSHQTATKALYPDDPSNVYHSYMGDHVQFRILHAGTNITHVHHQHAHQWLHSPNSDESDYRDSQMLSPGGSYTLDMTYFGSGNLNQTVGDSIFHCHFYPHFAQGMWSFWRVHDVFEEGTKLDGNGIPVLDWNRALPDGEIPNGTPIPAIVPMPTLAMAPMPVKTRVCPVYGATDYVQFTGDACPPPPGGKPVGYRGLVSKSDLDDPNLKEKNPGYPFFIPGVAGQRPPHPPLDFAPDEDASGNQIVISGKKQYLDGGLPRAQFLQEQGSLYEKHNAWDFSKDNDKLLGVEVDEEGTSLEKVAMAAHAIRKHPSVTPTGTPANFILNGQPPKPGAPFADPAIDIFGDPIPNSDCQKKEPGCVRYKAADIQMDVVLNKKGWHYPQQRILSLWGDVKANLDGSRRPEPLFFRTNSDKVVEYWLTNLVPAYYDLDDFQVRTPTDIIGQHIHLVKFDVTASDGAGNGFNYEDGTFSNEEVQSLIGNVNNDCGPDSNNDCGLYSTDATHRNRLTAKEIPYFATEFPGVYKGAQATVQRWFADPVWDCSKPVQAGKAPMPCKVDQDRTLRTVFTHDHFGPSTHQQVGLYAGLVVEPKDSKWFDSKDGTPLGGRFDGGPTTYQANINVADPTKSYREFLLEFQDRQLAYLNTSISAQKPYAHYDTNPGGPWGWADHDHAINAPNGPLTFRPGGYPTPDLITNQMSEGVYSLNYFNEPLAYRVDSGTADQKNLINVFRSMDRGDKDLNCQPHKGWPINPAPNCQTPSTSSGFMYPPPQDGAEDHDPYTPLLRAYEGDNVQIRNLVGAHMGPHSFHIHGLNWPFEPSLNSSGFRSTQGMGISEHYEFLFHLPVTSQATQADYLYIPTSDTNGLEYGNWGLLRGYKAKQSNLATLEETQAKAFPGGKSIPPVGSPAPACPASAPQRPFKVTAVYAQDALGGPLVYNARGGVGTPGVNPITDPNALMYVFTDDLAHGKPRQEPLVLRAAAGDCITVDLTNNLTTNETLNGGIPAQPPLNNDVTLQTSHDVGIHPQLLAYDVTTSDGFNIGKNPSITVPPHDQVNPPNHTTYTWYAGKVDRDATGKPVYTPVEFGSVSLAPADALMQDNFGLIGALIIEPQGSTWQPDDNTNLSATVTKPDKTSFREAVVMVQDDLASLDIPALNYRTEPFSYRYGNPEFLLNSGSLFSPLGISRGQSDTLVAADPQTPVFVAEAGLPLRMRVLHPAGFNEQVFELHGHIWQEEPYSKGSLKIVENNQFSQWTGSRDTFGPNASFDIVLKSAGGSNAVKGDYLFRTFIGAEFMNGMWGLLRVGDRGKDVVTVTTNCGPPTMTTFTVAGVNTVNPSNHHMAKTVTISGAGIPSGTASVDALTGQWTFTSASVTTPPAQITVTSSQGGTRTAPVMCAIQPPPGGPPPVSPSALTSLRIDKEVPAAKLTKDVERFRLTPPALAKPK